MLDLSEYETTQDSPEVAALKEQVRTVAKKYADRHNWCGVVNQALKEMGVEPKDDLLRLTVTTTYGWDLQTRIKVSKLLGKNEDEQRATVAKAIGTLTIMGDAAGTNATVPFTPELIADISNQTSPSSDGPSEPGTGPGVWAYVSDAGRVMHHYPHTTRREDGTYETNSRARYGGYHEATCRRSSAEAYRPSATSTSASGNRCTTCVDRLAAQ